MPTGAVTIGFDYSSTAAYLGMVNETEVRHTSKIIVGIDNQSTIYFCDALRTLFRILKRYNTVTDTVWIEKAWVNGQHFPLSGLMLARTSALIEICALEAGFGVEFVYPKVWRKAIYGGAAPKNPKEKAVEFVKEKFNYEVPTIGKTSRSKLPDHNIAEAILIASYGYERNLVTSGESR